MSKYLTKVAIVHFYFKTNQTNQWQDLLLKNVPTLPHGTYLLSEFLESELTFSASDSRPLDSSQRISSHRKQLGELFRGPETGPQTKPFEIRAM